MPKFEIDIANGIFPAKMGKILEKTGEGGLSFTPAIS